MRIITENLLNATSNTCEIPCTYIAHITNAQGVMGSGVAKQIKIAYPEAFKAYEDAYQNNGSEWMLGKVTRANHVLNLTAQRYYGYNGKRYLDYGYLWQCLREVSEDMCWAGDRIAVPYLMGCDRAGGDWNVVTEMLQGFEREFGVEFIVCKLEG